MDVCGACERIKTTPLARSYKALARQGILFYVLVAPWSISLDLGLWGIPALALGFYFLLGLELTAEDVEQPFGVSADDLPLASYCEAIEHFVQSILAVSDASPDAAVAETLHTLGVHLN
jgi:putative membrane protein